MFGSCFRTLAVILVSNFLQYCAAANHPGLVLVAWQVLQVASCARCEWCRNLLATCFGLLWPGFVFYWTRNQNTVWAQIVYEKWGCAKQARITHIITVHADANSTTRFLVSSFCSISFGVSSLTTLVHVNVGLQHEISASIANLRASKAKKRRRRLQNHNY